MSLARKVQKSLTVRGYLGTLAFALVYLWRQVFPHSEPPNAAAEQDFDARYGTDTAGFIPLSDLDVSADTWMQGGAYQGIGVDTDFAKLLPAIRYEDFTFIDMGSGKGRAVMLASRLPWREVVGVEFAPSLHATAERNVALWREARSPIRLVCADATSWPLPAGPLVVFLYNSFGADLMRQVAARVAGHPAPVIVVYCTPKHPEGWDALMQRVSERPGCIVWATSGPLPDSS